MRITAVMIGMLISTVAHAQGVLFTQKQTRNGQSSQTQIAMDKEHLRLETDGIVTIFDSSKPAAYMINPAKKTYVEWTKAAVDEMAQQLAQEMIKRVLPTASPEQQRQIIEQSMRSRVVATTAEPPKREYFERGPDKVGNWPCTKYEEIGSIVCIAEPGVFGLTPADFEIARQFEQFMSDMTPGVRLSPRENPLVTGTVDGKEFSGIALRHTSYLGTGQQSVTEITEIRREAFSRSLIEIPSGFLKETSLPRP